MDETEEIKIYIEVEINPTESEQKVIEAVENLFSDITMQVKTLERESLLIAESRTSETLTKIYNLLRRERIRSAARTVLRRGLDGNVISFCLNKQVAYAGHISFCEEKAESPLGPIKVQIESDNPRDLINWLAPKME
jgi:predicted RNA binding protein with dsRBD fold (UPF0201 family)